MATTKTKVTLDELNRRLIVLERAKLDGGLGLTERYYPIEYEGAILTDLGSVSTAGTFTTHYDTVNNLNSLQWISSNANLQDYSISVQFIIPSNFVNWDTNAFRLYIRTGTTSSSNNKIKLNILKNGTSIKSADNLTSPSSTSWYSVNITATQLGNWSINDRMTIQITMYSKLSNPAQISEMKLDWK